jgi:hypothetical protein
MSLFHSSRNMEIGWKPEAERRCFARFRWKDVAQDSVGKMLHKSPEERYFAKITF